MWLVWLVWLVQCFSASSGASITRPLSSTFSILSLCASLHLLLPINTAPISFSLLVKQPPISLQLHFQLPAPQSQVLQRKPILPPQPACRSLLLGKLLGQVHFLVPLPSLHPFPAEPTAILCSPGHYSPTDPLPPTLQTSASLLYNRQLGSS